MFTPETYTAPSSWAPYYINGDSTGMDSAEIEAADAFMAWVGLGAPVDCLDHGFSWHHDAFQFCPLGADCQEYTFLRREPSSAPKPKRLPRQVSGKVSRRNASRSAVNGPARLARR